jgi:hypothetical protein
MSEQTPPPPEESRRGEHNELDYRNADEEGEFDERGSQGPGRGEPEPDENPQD